MSGIYDINGNNIESNQNIIALPKKTSSQMAATDYLLGIDSAEGYQMLIQDLGDYIIQHATSSLAGANQTLAAAVNALNSNKANSLNLSTGSTVVGTLEAVKTAFLNKINSMPDSSTCFMMLEFSTFVPEFPGGGKWVCKINKASSKYQTISCEYASGYIADVVYPIFVENENGTWHFNNPNSKLGNPNTAGFHNAIYRGKNITSYLTDGSLWNRIKGTNGYALFDDLFLGDYITVGSNSYAIVDFDYYLRTGSTDVTEHHIVMMPVGNMNIPAGTVLYGSSDTLTLLNGSDVTQKETATAFKWNATAADPNTSSTNGGYKFSRMRTVIMKAADTIVVNAFGASHVKPIAVLYHNPSDASASGLASGWAWFTSDDWTNPERKSICDLPNETQIYGQQVFGRGSAYTNVGYEIGIDKFQFALCGLQKNFVNNRATYWLRSVNSAHNAAWVGDYGAASSVGVAYALGVRPRFILVG